MEVGRRRSVVVGGSRDAGGRTRERGCRVCEGFGRGAAQVAMMGDSCTIVRAGVRRCGGEVGE